MFSSLLIKIFELIFSLFFLILLLPLFFLISLILIIFQGYPIFFISKRVGKNGINFKIYKFRTMKNKIHIKDKDQITNIGNFFRKLSLDEIPQLINILKGDMSLVGPRPLPLYIEKDIKYDIQLIRRSIKPGLTGLAQINFVKNRPFLKKINDDINYSKNFSISLYFYILIMTIPIVLKKFFLKS